MGSDSADRTQRAIEEAQARLAELVAKIDRDALVLAFLREVRFGLRDLRRFLEDPAEDRVSWDFPFVELTYPVLWDFSSPDQMPPTFKGLETVGIFAPEDVVDGKVPEDVVFACLVEAEATLALGFVTRGVVQVRDSAKIDPSGPPAYIMPRDLVDLLDKATNTRATVGGVEGTPEDAAARARLVDELTAPFSMGPYAGASLAASTAAQLAEVENYTEEERAELMKDARALTDEEWQAAEDGREVFDELMERRPDVPALVYSGVTDAGEKIGVAVVAQVFPLVVDVDARRAWYTVGVGLVFTEGDQRRLSPEDLGDLWAELTRPDAHLAAALAPRDETPERSTKATAEQPKAGPTEPRTARLLLQEKTRIDAKAAQVVGFLDRATFPRKWSHVRKWEDLVQAEVAALQKKHGEAAFEDVPGIRKALLIRKETAAGKELVELTKVPTGDLMDREGRRGFRRVYTDADKIPREYLVKRFRAGSAYLEVRLSWYGGTWRLSDDARKAEEARLRGARREADGLLFEDLRAEEQGRIDNALRHLGTLGDARDVMDYVLGVFGARGENPLRIPAREFRILLECEQDENGHSRVEGALRALQEIRFAVKAAGAGPDISGHAFGAFLDTVRYEGRGPGKHTDGDFYLSLSELAIGTLHVFRRAGSLNSARQVIRYDWSAKLEKEAKKELRFLQGHKLAPFYDRAKGFTPAQRLLHRWLAANITRRKDATAKGRKAQKVHHSAADANEPRVYGADFCRLLEANRRYHAALGQYSKNAETGRTLKGRPQARTATGGAKQGGLLEVLGYGLPPGRADAGRTRVAADALKDLRAVVEEALGGVVAAKHRDGWLTLEDAAGLRVDELLEEVTWFLFLPEDWEEGVARDIEDHQERRRKRGETDRAVRVTKDRAAYEQALEDRGEAVGGVGLVELRQRLHAARKARKLSQAEVGRAFGVSQAVVANWEQGPERKGRAIPEDLRPLVLRWIKTGEGPTETELETLAARRRGGRRAAL